MLRNCCGVDGFIFVLILTLLNFQKIKFTFCIVCVETETVAGGSFVENQPKCVGELIFEETFASLNLEKWKHEITLSGGGNWEFQYYTNNRSNSYVENGLLHIRPTLLADDYTETFLHTGTLDISGNTPDDKCTDSSYYGCIRKGTSINYLNPIKSAKITTATSFNFKYGRVEISAKMPSGDWLWPAIWMMPRYNFYGKWPSSGEIDIVEARGNKFLLNADGANIGTQQVGSTLHWGPFNALNQWAKTHFIKSNGLGFDAEFHRYELEWSSTNLTFYIDGELIGSVIPPREGGFWEMSELNNNNNSALSEGIHNPWKGGTRMAPFDEKFFLILNLAVGGVGFFPDNTENPGGKPWTNNSTTAYRDFWQGRDQWLPTWNLENSEMSHLIVDYVRVYAI